MPVDWERLTSQLARYESAVLNGPDRDGYPYSVRCHPQPDAATRTLLLSDVTAPLREGPASLLCHWHDERLWNQRSFVARGQLARNGAGWRFTPTQLIVGLDNGPITQGRLFMHARGVAARYLAKRGLPRPIIPWAEVIRIKHEAQANLRARGERR
ncbi:MAG TPA: hypothetical protein VFQ25_00180 [Ktedonobacterales bacterium]|nr:hypothetical protein [Ktedonobacterales bacterium]